MIAIKNNIDCCGCYSCFNACPAKCISMHPDEEGFYYPIIDKNTCVNCGLCNKVCPFQNLNPLMTDEPETYAAILKDNVTRKESSSGGVFSLIAEHVLSNDGVVYGVAFSENFDKCKHIRIENVSDLRLLRGSKYIQSEIGEVYKLVRDDLNKDKLVLFTGVPCQINGLILFLGKKYDNLFIIEIVCHGVPSPKLWHKYVDYLEKKYGENILSVNFRSKKNGWHKFGLEIGFDSSSLFMSLDDDPFFIMFLKNLCLRPSCYNCKIKGRKSVADFTIADFWGVEMTQPDLDDDLGTSLLLLQSEKGKRFFELVSGGVISKKVNFKHVIQYNSAYYSSCHLPKERKSFFKDMNTISFNTLIVKYCKKKKTGLFKKVMDKIIYKAKRLIRKN